MLSFQQDSWHARLWQRMHVHDKKWIAFTRAVREERIRGNSSRQIAKRNQNRFQQGLVSLCPYFWSNVFGVVAYLPFIYVVRPLTQVLFRFFGTYARPVALVGIGSILIGLTYYRLSDLPQRRAAVVLNSIEDASNLLLYKNQQSLQRIADERYRREHRAELEAMERQQAEEDQRLVAERLRRERLQEAGYIQRRLDAWPPSDHLDHVQGEMHYWNFEVHQPVRGAWHDVLGFFVGLGIILLIVVGMTVCATLAMGTILLLIVAAVWIAEQISKTKQWQSFIGPIAKTWHRFTRTIADAWQLTKTFIRYRYREHLCPYITFRNGQSQS